MNPPDFISTQINFMELNPEFEKYQNFKENVDLKDRFITHQEWMTLCIVKYFLT